MKNLTFIFLLLSGAFLCGCTTQSTQQSSPTEESISESAEVISPSADIPKETIISIDGDPSDWEEYDILQIDPEGDAKDGDFDIIAIRTFSNDRFLYLLVETRQPPTDYAQIDLAVYIGEKDFLISFSPKDSGSGFMVDVTGGEFKEIGLVQDSQSAVAEAVEFKLPLSVFENTSELSLSVHPMNGQCCLPPAWYSIDSSDYVPVPALDEVEPALDLTLPPPPPEQSKIIAQTQLDLSRYRCDEPMDIVTNTDRTLAYTVCGNVDTLMVIDTSTDQVINVLPLHEEAEHPFGTTPRLIEITPDDEILLVGNDIDRSLSIINADTLSIIKTLRLDMKPAKIAAAPDGEVAYVVGHESGALHVLDIDDGRILTKSPLPNAKGPYSVAFAPDGSAAYVAATENGMYQIDTVTHQPVNHVDLPNAGWCGDMIVTEDGSTVYLAAVESDWVAEIDTGTMKMTRKFDVLRPQSLLLSEDESYMFIGNFTAFLDSESIVVLDLASGEVTNKISLTTPAPHVSWTPDIEGLAYVGDGTRFYAPGVDADGIFVIDVASQHQSGFIPLTQFATLQPEHLIINSEGSTLYTLNIAPQAPSISVIDSASGESESFYYLDTGNPCFASTSNREQSPSNIEEASIALMPDDRTLFVSTDTCLLTFDTVTKTFIEANLIDIPSGHYIQDLVVSPEGEYIYLIDTGGVLLTLDSKTLAIKASVQAVNHGFNVKVAPDNSRVYVTGWEEYAAVDTATNTVLARETINVLGNEQLFAYPDRAIGIPSHHEFYTIGDFDYMQVYDSVKNTLLRSIDLYPWAPNRTLVTDVIFSPDGKTGYLALWDLKGITVFDTTTWKMIAQIDTGYYPVYGVCPNDFAFHPDGNLLYVAGEQSDNIIVIDTTTNQVVNVITLVP